MLTLVGLGPLSLSWLQAPDSRLKWIISDLKYPCGLIVGCLLSVCCRDCLNIKLDLHLYKILDYQVCEWTDAFKVALYNAVDLRNLDPDCANWIKS